MTEDERIDFEKCVTESGIDVGREYFCDLLWTAEQELRRTRLAIDSSYEFNARLSTPHLIDLGKSSAHSIIDCLVDDMPIDFRKVLSVVLEEDESVVNEDDILDRIREGTETTVKGAINARSRASQPNPTATKAAG